MDEIVKELYDYLIERNYQPAWSSAADIFPLSENSEITLFLLKKVADLQAEVEKLKNTEV